MKDWVPLIVAVIAAAAAVTGYLINGALARIAARREAYAEALAEVQRYNQLPYRFRRRGDDSPETIERLATLLGDTQARLAYHRRRIELEDADVAKAFNAYVDKLRESNGLHRRDALNSPAAVAPVDIEFDGYPFAARDERRQCVRAMRENLSLRASLRRTLRRSR